MAEELTPTQLLDRFEYSWRTDLQSVNLVGEIETDSALATVVLQAVGYLARKPSGASRLSPYPACVAVSLATFASSHYEGGALWPSVFKHIGVQDSTITRGVIGEAFLKALQRLDLPTIEDGATYLGPISFHAVIPDYCLRDVLVLLQQRQELNPGLDGQSFVSWAGGRPGRLNDLDKPAARFFLQGGEYAIDLVDRLIDMLEGLRSGLTDVDDLVALSGAPTRLVTKAVGLAGDGTLDLSPSSRPTGRPSRASMLEGPHLVLDLDRSSVVLRLPQLAGLNERRVHWAVLLDGDPTTTHGGAEGGRSGHDFEEAILARPVRHVMATLGEHQSFEFDVVPSDEPLLAFDRDGRFLPSGAPLPADDVWLLYPDSKGRPSSDEAELDTKIHLMGPVGWDGWVLDQVSLNDVPYVEFVDQVRSVHHRGRPVISTPEAMPGLFTPAGGHVLSERPTVALPRLGSETEWRVEARSVATGELVTSDNWSSAARAAGEEPFAYADPFDGIPAPVVGEFDLLVRGPLGTRVTSRVAVAEGLTQRTSVNCRSFVAHGLTPVTVDWGSTSGLAIEPARKDFAATELSLQLTITSPNSSLAVVSEPNHLEVCRVVDGEATDWTASALTLPSDGRGDLGTLEVRMATGHPLPPLTLVGDSGLQQTLPTTGGAGARQRYDLARIADTLRAERVARLQWVIGDDTTILATFRPDRLCSGAEIDGQTLRLRDFAAVPDAAVGLYQFLAPWRDVVVAKVNDSGEAHLPEDLHAAGPLAVLARLEDPWAPAPWPEWPAKLTVAEADGWPQSSDDAEASVIHWLTGLRRIPSDPEAFPYLWSGWAKATYVSQWVAAKNLTRDVTAQFALAPKAAIEAVLETRIDRATALQMGMGAGLVSARTCLGEGLEADLWRRFPALAATSDTATKSLPWDAIESLAGPMAQTIASGSTEWDPGVGRFEHAPALNALASHDLEELWRVAQVVPAGLVDRETRAAAAMSLFRVRFKTELRALCDVGPTILRASTIILREAGFHGTLAWVEARGSGSQAWHWEVLPQVSAALGAMARLAARGDSRAALLLDESMAQWQSLARRVPELVEMDIVIAEMLARAATDPYRAASQSMEDTE